MGNKALTVDEEATTDVVSTHRWWIRFVVVPISVVLIGGTLGYWLKERKRSAEIDKQESITAVQIMENSDLPMYLTDSDFKITYVNKAYISFFAVEKSTLIGKSIWAAIELNAKFVPDSLKAKFSKYQQEIQSRATKELLPHADDLIVFDMRNSPNLKHRYVYEMRIHIDKIFSREVSPALGLFCILIPTQVPHDMIN